MTERQKKQKPKDDKSNSGRKRKKEKKESYNCKRDPTVLKVGSMEFGKNSFLLTSF